MGRAHTQSLQFNPKLRVHFRIHNWPHSQMLILIAALIMLQACAPAPSGADPTPDIQAIYTAAQQTFSAQDAAQAALTPRTATPSPTATSTASPNPTRPSTGQSVCDNSTYLSDVTIPDGTVIAAGKAFTKTWLLQNSGNCAWTTTYKLAFASGDPMGGAEASIPLEVPSGGQSELSVNLTAPSSAGTYTGHWQMKNAQGQPFGNVITVVISVGAAEACHSSSRTEVTISGHTGPDRVTIDYGDGMTETDTNGDYSFTVPMGWSGTVIPSKAKVNPWTFDPPQRTYTNLTCDLTKQNFKAIPPPGV